MAFLCASCEHESFRDERAKEGRYCRRDFRSIKDEKDSDKCQENHWFVARMGTMTLGTEAHVIVVQVEWQQIGDEVEAEERFAYG